MAARILVRASRGWSARLAAGAAGCAAAYACAAGTSCRAHGGHSHANHHAHGHAAHNNKALVELSGGSGGSSAAKHEAHHAASGMAQPRRPSWLSAGNIASLVTCVDAIIALPSFSGAEEQFIFESAVLSVVSAVEAVLPAPYLSLCSRTDEGLCAEQAEALRARLCESICVSLPFLQPTAEWQVVHFVVRMLTSAMVDGCSLSAMLEDEAVGPVVLEVFVKGNAGAFISRREACAEELADSIALPLLPRAAVGAACARAVDVLAHALEDAMMSA